MKTLEGLNKYAKDIHKGNVERGFYEKPASRAKRLLLIVSEVIEAFEADRSDRDKEGLEAFDGLIDNGCDFKAAFQSSIKDTYQDEIADSIIRLLDLSAFENIDIERHIELKLKYNATRPYKHGKKY